jgi:hypothetical protein
MASAPPSLRSIPKFTGVQLAEHGGQRTGTSADNHRSHRKIAVRSSSTRDSFVRHLLHVQYVISPTLQHSADHEPTSISRRKPLSGFSKPSHEDRHDELSRQYHILELRSNMLRAQLVAQQKAAEQAAEQAHQRAANMHANYGQRPR